MEAITFNGPFTWYAQNDLPSLFETAEGKQHGIYLWSVPQAEGEYVYYVGETGRTFAARLLEHLKEHLAGFYHLYDPIEFQNGRKLLRWPGRYDPDKRVSIDDIIENHTTIANTAASLAKIYRFYLAATDAEARLRRRIESSLADYLYEARGGIPNYQDKGIHYSRRSAGEQLLTCKVGSPKTLLGMPLELEI